MRARPSEQVAAWVLQQPADELCTTAVTVAEIRYGIARLDPGRRRDELAAAAHGTFTAYAAKIMAFDAAAAEHYADVVVEREKSGAPIGGFDAQIAAICRGQGAALATRNTEDFRLLGLDLRNPWRASDPP